MGSCGLHPAVRLCRCSVVILGYCDEGGTKFRPW